MLKFQNPKAAKTPLLAGPEIFNNCQVVAVSFFSTLLKLLAGDAEMGQCCIEFEQLDIKFETGNLQDPDLKCSFTLALNYGDRNWFNERIAQVLVAFLMNDYVRACGVRDSYHLLYTFFKSCDSSGLKHPAIVQLHFNNRNYKGECYGKPIFDGGFVAYRNRTLDDCYKALDALNRLKEEDPGE